MFAGCLEIITQAERIGVPSEYINAEMYYFSTLRAQILSNHKRKAIILSYTRGSKPVVSTITALKYTLLITKNNLWWQ